jgi:hypothetical protein
MDYSSPRPGRSGSPTVVGIDSVVGQGDQVASDTLEHWRAVVRGRMRFHEGVFHEELRETREAVDLLDVLVGRTRLGPRDEGGLAAGIADVSDVADGQARLTQLRQLRSVADSIQLGIDVLRSRRQLAAESAGARGSAEAAFQSLPGGQPFKRHLPSGHAKTAGVVRSTVQWLERTGFERELERRYHRRRLLDDAPLAELSAAVRTLADDNNRKESLCAVLERELQLHNDLLAREEEAIGSSVVAGASDSATRASTAYFPESDDVYLPRDPREWSDWARELEQLCYTSPPVAPSPFCAPPDVAENKLRHDAGSSAASASSGTTSGGKASKTHSIFYADPWASGRVASELPEMRYWLQSVNALFSGSISRVSDSVFRSHSSSPN